MKFFNRTILLILLISCNVNNLFAQEQTTDPLPDSITVYVNSYYLSPKDISSIQSARMPIRDLENPQVSNNIGGKLTQNRNYYSLSSLLSNVAGISQGWASVSPYYNLRGFNVRSYIRNGIDGYLSAEMDPANLEQLSVVKGPSGSLFGSTLISFGGLINRITKKPIDSTFSEVGFSAGSYGFYRVNMDINTALDKAHKILFRFNGAYTDQASFQDAGFSRVAFAAPSFEYRVNDRLRIELESEIQYRRGSSNSQIAPMNPIVNGVNKNADNSNALALDYKKSYSNNSIYLNNPSINIYGKVQYKISPNWLSETNLVNTWAENTGNYLMMNLINGDSSLVRKISNYPDGNFRTQQIQQNFIEDFNIGKVRNRMVIGFDYYRYASNTSSNGLNGSGMSMGGSMPGMSMPRPSFDTLSLYTANNNYGTLSPTLINNKLLGFAPTRTSSLQNTYYVYLSDVVNPIEALSILVGGRIDRFNNAGSTDLNTGTISGRYNQTAFSPKLGFTYQLLSRRIAIFGNYMNGFQNTAPVMQVDGTTSTFKPQYGNQWEAGVKINLAERLLDATLSYYDIRVSNVVRNDPNDATMYIQDGKQYSRGVEADVQSQPFQGFYIHGGVAYNDSKYTATSTATEGLRPVNSGPKWTGNWYATYRIEQGKLNGLGIGFGGNYYDKNLIINSTTSGTFFTNAYTLLNAQLYYDRPSYAFAVSMSNLTNKHYYYGGAGFITPGMPRQFILSIKLKL